MRDGAGRDGARAANFTGAWSSTAAARKKKKKTTATATAPAFKGEGETGEVASAFLELGHVQETPRRRGQVAHGDDAAVGCLLAVL
jgi:hypothetical protein